MGRQGTIFFEIVHNQIAVLDFDIAKLPEIADSTANISKATGDKDIELIRMQRAMLFNSIKNRNR